MNPAEQLANQPPGILDKLVRIPRQEKVIPYDILRHRQPLLRLLKVKVDKEILEEGCDRVRVLIFLHLDDPGEFADMVSARRF